MNGVGHLFLQRDVQQRIKDPMYVTDRFDVCVDYAKKRCFHVSDRDVFQNVTIDVNRMNTSSQIRKKFRHANEAAYNESWGCNPTDEPGPD